MSRFYITPSKMKKYGAFSNNKRQIFVWINTAIPYDKQVFAAAHELYHLWFEKVEIILRSDIEETNDTENIPENELRANDFCRVLTNEELLLQEIRNYNMDKNKLDIKIFETVNLFMFRIKQW